MTGECIVLFPYGGNTREAVTTIDALNSTGANINIGGFLDDFLAEAALCSHPLLGTREAWSKWRGQAKLLAAPGSPSSYLSRQALIDSFSADEHDWARIIDPSARVSALATLGFNTLIQAHCYVGTNAKIGNHCVVLPHVVVSHDSTIGDYTMIGAQASISGDVTIGRNCYIGAASSFHHGVKIGDGALVGIGATVIRDVPARAVVVGNPARVLRVQP
jgi:sugar O-acyltransferase (sialic acid O-acetyltransferase NeuD family)